ncbi:c-type cytochrome [Pararhodobacter oceanensis]|uniref:c-type cytochrome n=1 Tax=Pararhodobacter oceanensis TaxID=2172121 RepID=UPI003A8DD67D
MPPIPRLPIRCTAIAALLASALTTPLLAQSDERQDPNIAARQNLMQLQAYNLGVLGGMAQGRMAYDAEMAATAASNLVHLTRLNTDRMWAEGTDNAAVEGTRALPAIWADMEGFAARGAALTAAAEAMEAAAGVDLATLQGAIGGLGGACSGCHQNFRQAD